MSHASHPPPAAVAGRPRKRQRAANRGRGGVALSLAPGELPLHLPVPLPEDYRFASPSPWIPMDDSALDNQLYRGPAIVGEHGWNHGFLSHFEQPAPKPLLANNAAFGLDYLGLDLDTVNARPPHTQRAMSTVSSITTCSPPSTISQPSSSRSALSPVQTEHPSDWLTTASTYSRGPSPLQQVVSTVAKGNEFLCLGPQCEESFTSAGELKSHIKSVHTHTCNWAGCDQSSFSTRDGLIWHVKLEHLLVCPAPGCAESSFQSKWLLECHIRNAHPDHNTAKDPTHAETPKPTSQKMVPTSSAQSSSAQNSSATLAAARKDLMEDRAIREILSVERSKKKCREQLKMVVEKRAKKATGTPRAADSPTDLVRSRTPRLIESASFPIVWEHGVLPFLIEFIPKWCGPGHVISVTRGKRVNSRRVCFMTKRKLSRARRMIIASHVRDLLPNGHKQLTSFSFSTGEVDRLVWARGLSSAQPDEICLPRNPYFFKDPCMGDSIGIAGNGDFEDSTSTLGPCLVVGGGEYWLANFHPFVDAYQRLEIVGVEHPSPDDRSRCMGQKHDAMSDEDEFGLGNITATSGIDLKTTRVSHDPYWEECDKEPPLIVTDWSLITAKTRQANILRRFPLETMPLLKETPIKSATVVTPGAVVISTGRTSGHQRGQICEIPAYVSGDRDGNGTGKATREWFVEEPDPYDDEEAWIRGGIGVEGDSGAAIVDLETNAITGQLWGRNKYFGAGPRLTFFTPISDIFDDIQEKCGLEQGRPQLPQYRDEANRYPMYPSCRQCYDLRTYLDSRRSSRASLRSMIGRNESDPDLTSIEALSELATPKDHSHWLRHTVEEAGSSFNSGLSPAGLNSLYYFTPHPGTPGVVDVKSPYALTLSAEDLYDGDCHPPTDISTGKRPAAPPMLRTLSQGGTKRPRIN